ncbi:MAG: SUMF1/EgtB/PvdO family nonheme iron enzyme [Pyrinomonadaceae bacterium]
MKECQLCKKCYTDEVNTCPEDGLPTFHSLSGEPVLEGKYHLDRRLGQGGMGVVYCAKHAYLKTQHAIKVILPDLVGNDPQLVTRFRQEALAAAAIRHHNVVQVTDYGVAQGTMPFLVMEYVEGESLHDLLARDGKLSPEKALELMSAICAGIGAAHKQGIVHRDLKPLNIMLVKNKSTMDEAVKILDFGLAKIKSGELLGSFIQAQTTGLMGSPYYMAPEQWSDEDPDGRSDVYSLAVMLFQMLTGDVPFKGSSIPAIMKKHLTDPPTSFNEIGVIINPDIEKVVRHALEKKPSNRTATVEDFVGELRNAVLGSQNNVGTVSATHHPVSSLRILTNPPQSKVFIDKVAIGESQPDGWLILEGLQSGSHHLTIRHAGYGDWENNIVCDGNSQQIVAKLEKAIESFDNAQNDTSAIPKPPVPTIAGIQVDMPVENFNRTRVEESSFQQTNQQNWNTGHQQVAVEPVPKKSLFSPLVLAIIGIGSLFLLTTIGIGAAYLMGLFSETKVPGNVANSASPSPTLSPSGNDEVKTEMVKISGGKFTMGRSDGDPSEKPEHEVEVADFWMDKTEVSNTEYYEFVKETNYNTPAVDWSNGKPISGKENFPVVRVSIEDINKFAAWRSGRDGKTYRLPTEEEWEYAARNGSKNNLYPWGDRWEKGIATVEFDAAKPVGSNEKGANIWGVRDLIGNVWEWTGSEIKPYPGSSYEISKGNSSEFVIRGGGYVSKSTGNDVISSTTRKWVPVTRQDGLLGFRLVRSE